MKALTVTMPLVSACKVEECAYNACGRCHAKAITVGDGARPACDTYFCLSTPSAQHIHNQRIIAGVGACKVRSCQHNLDYECMADGIAVGYDNEAIRCLTYLAR